MAHQPVVGVHGNPEPELAQQPERMGGNGRRRSSLHVRRWAHLQGDAPVPYVGRQRPQLDLTGARGYSDVVDDPDAMAEALGPAVLDGLPDRRQPEALTGVDGRVEVLPVHVLERVEV